MLTEQRYEVILKLLEEKNSITVITHEPTVEQKAEVNVEAKQLVAAKAAALIRPEDFIYLDAGTTTASMLSYLTEKSATFVTNAVAHAKIAAGILCFVIKRDGK